MAYREDPFAGRLPRIAVFGKLGMQTEGVMECVAACEADAAARVRYKEMGIEVYTPEQADEMVARDDIDIVAIKTPNFLHKEMTVKALDAGKDVWVEKPLGINHEELDEIIAARKRSGKEVQVNLELRNSRLFLRVKEVIAELGLKPMAVFWHVRDFNKVTDEGGQKLSWWRMDKKLSGGYFVEKMIHYIDQSIWWMERPVQFVRTFTPPIVTSRYKNIMDNLTLNLGFSEGRTGSLQWTQFGGHDQEYDFCVVGREGAVFCRWIERGWFRLELTVCDSVLDDEGNVIKTPLKRREQYHDIDHTIMGHDSPKCMIEFIKYLRGEREHQTAPFDDVVHTMRVVLAGEESAVTGKDVAIRKD